MSVSQDIRRAVSDDNERGLAAEQRDIVDNGDSTTKSELSADETLDDVTQPSSAEVYLLQRRQSRISRISSLSYKDFQDPQRLSEKPSFQSGQSSLFQLTGGISTWPKQGVDLTAGWKKVLGSLSKLPDVPPVSATRSSSMIDESASPTETTTAVRTDTTERMSVNLARTFRKQFLTDKDELAIEANYVMETDPNRVLSPYPDKPKRGKKRFFTKYSLRAPLFPNGNYLESEMLPKPTTLCAEEVRNPDNQIPRRPAFSRPMQEDDVVKEEPPPKRSLPLIPSKEDVESEDVESSTSSVQRIINCKLSMPDEKENDCRDSDMGAHSGNQSGSSAIVLSKPEADFKYDENADATALQVDSQFTSSTQESTSCSARLLSNTSEDTDNMTMSDSAAGDRRRTPCDSVAARARGDSDQSALASVKSCWSGERSDDANLRESSATSSVGEEESKVPVGKDPAARLRRSMLVARTEHCQIPAGKKPANVEDPRPVLAGRSLPEARGTSKESMQKVVLPPRPASPMETTEGKAVVKEIAVKPKFSKAPSPLVHRRSSEMKLPPRSSSADAMRMGKCSGRINKAKLEPKPSALRTVLPKKPVEELVGAQTLLNAEKKFEEQLTAIRKEMDLQREHQLSIKKHLGSQGEKMELLVSGLTKNIDGQLKNLCSEFANHMKAGETREVGKEGPIPKVAGSTSSQGTMTSMQKVDELAMRLSKLEKHLRMGLATALEKHGNRSRRVMEEQVAAMKRAMAAQEKFFHHQARKLYADLSTLKNAVLRSNSSQRSLEEKVRMEERTILARLELKQLKFERRQQEALEELHYTARDLQRRVMAAESRLPLAQPKRDRMEARVGRIDSAVAAMDARMREIEEAIREVATICEHMVATVAKREKASLTAEKERNSRQRQVLLGQQQCAYSRRSGPSNEKRRACESGVDPPAAGVEGSRTRRRGTSSREGRGTTSTTEVSYTLKPLTDDVNPDDSEFFLSVKDVFYRRSGASQTATPTWTTGEFTPEEQWIEEELCKVIQQSARVRFSRLSSQQSGASG